MEVEALGETIAADSQGIEVECHRLYTAPSFGRFVRVAADPPQYAVVTRIGTAPLDSARVVQAHRLPPGELEARKPHLSALLRTVFSARLVGYGTATAHAIGTPPVPPRLHAFVYPADPEEIRRLTASPAFLRPLTLATDIVLEDLLLATIAAAREAWGAEAPLVTWGKYLARLLVRDYLTLEGVLHRLGEAGAWQGPGGERRTRVGGLVEAGGGVVPPARRTLQDRAAGVAAAAAGVRVLGPRPEKWEERVPLIAGTAAPAAPDAARRTAPPSRDPDDDPFAD